VLTGQPDGRSTGATAAHRSPWSPAPRTKSVPRATGFFVLCRRPEFNANELGGEPAVLQSGGRREGKDKLDQNIRAGSASGGPIIKNKDVLLRHLQVLRATRSREVLRTVYTQDARNGVWRYVVGGRNQPAGVSGASVDANGIRLPASRFGHLQHLHDDPAGIGQDAYIRSLHGQTPLPNDFTQGDAVSTPVGASVLPERARAATDATLRVDHVFDAPQLRLWPRCAPIWVATQNSSATAFHGGEPLFPAAAACVRQHLRTPLNWAR